jgi:hypothetical protein
MQSWVRGRQSFGVQGAHFPDLFRNMPMAIDPAVIGERDPKHGENIKQLALFGGDGILACGSAGGCSRLGSSGRWRISGSSPCFRSH